jgi:hypothetical protein
MKITIKDVPIELFDANMELLNGGQPKKVLLDKLIKGYEIVRQEYEMKIKQQEADKASRPDESQRITSANPASVEHKKEGKNETLR